MTRLAYIQPGDPLNTSYREHNDIVEATRGFRDFGLSGERSYLRTFSETVEVRNDSDSDFEFGTILEVTGLVIDPHFYPDAHKYGPIALTVDELSSDFVDEWVSLAEPIKAGDFGHAYIRGIFPTKIYNPGGTAKFCNPRSDFPTFPHLHGLGDRWGEAKIIAQATVAGEDVNNRWAVVEKLEKVNLFLGKADAAITKGNFGTVSRWSQNGYQYNGLGKSAEEDTGENNQALARMGDVGEGDWVLYKFFDADLEIIQAECSGS